MQQVTGDTDLDNLDISQTCITKDMKDQVEEEGKLIILVIQ